MDCCFKTEDGRFNYRVGAIIRKGRSFLMARNPRESREFYYTVGGRVKLGEALADAVIREVKEETGIECEVERPLALHENFFTDDDGERFHEIAVFFLIKDNEELQRIEDHTLTDHGSNGEYLIWLDPQSNGEKTVYPAFFKELDLHENNLKHFVTREAQG